LLAFWAAVPWLDRRARENQPSPMFTDVAFAAIVFISFLTLKAWDVGAGEEVTEQDASAIAQMCAIILLGIAAATSVLRVVVYRHRWFWLSGATVLHAALHGLADVSYLTAGFVGLAVAALSVLFMRPSEAAAPDAS
jgi:hypothetical protein